MTERMLTFFADMLTRLLTVCCHHCQRLLTANSLAADLLTSFADTFRIGGGIYIPILKNTYISVSKSAKRSASSKYAAFRVSKVLTKGVSKRQQSQQTGSAPVNTRPAADSDRSANGAAGSAPSKYAAFRVSTLPGGVA